MEPFSISCTTCQARLRVQDESAIGQILACPKCGSMVMIQPPAGKAADPAPRDKPESSSAKPAAAEPPPSRTPAALAGAKPAAAATSNTPAREKTPPATATDQEPAVAQPPAEGRPSRKFKFREDFQETPDPVEPATARAPVTAAPPRTVATPAAASEDGEHSTTRVPGDTPAGPLPFWRRNQQWLLIAAAGVIGIVLALLVVGLVSRRGRSQAPDDVAQGQTKTGAKSAAQPAAKQSGKGRGEDAGGKQQPGPESQTPAAGDNAAQAQRDNSDGAADPTAPDTSTDTQPGGKTEPQVPPDLVDPATAAGTSEPITPDESTGMEGRAGGAAGTGPGAEVGTVMDTATRGKLMFPFVAIQFKPEDEVRLADFCSFLSEAINVPITLDIDALLSAGLTSEAFVECDLRGVTAQQALSSVLEKLGITFTLESAGIVVGVAEAHELATRSYDVADLVEDEAQLTVLRGWVTSLVDPPSWDTQGGDGTVSAGEQKLEVYQTGVTHYRLARFLDRLRTARGLLPRSDLPPDDIDLTPAFIQMAENLNLVTAASFPRPTPFRDVLNHLQGETDLRMLPDWQSMLAAGVTPTLELSPGLAEQPLHQILKELLPPLDLEYRAVDAGTLQISGKAALEVRADVELYPILNAEDLDERKLIAQLQELVGAPYFTPTGGTGAMAYDKVGQCLMVSLPQPQQRLVATWLVTNRQTDFGLGAAR